MKGSKVRTGTTVVIVVLVVPAAGLFLGWTGLTQPLYLVTAVAPGETTITAEASGVSGDAVLSVEVFAAVKAGSYFTCGVTTDGVVYCWGWNNVGQLGDGTTTERNTPVRIVW